MRKSVVLWGVLTATTLAMPGIAGGNGPRKPRVDIRATPRMAFSPAEVLVVVKLTGGDEHEDFYCPDVEWEFGDGSRSGQQADCEPFAEGMALERHFTARHAYRQPGDYEVRVTLRRASRTLAVSTTRVTVHGGSALASR
jgi:PKD domain-containing protein